jgi:uncharacterized protein
MTNSGKSDCPFVAGGMLTESQFFVGREQEIGFVMRMMTNAQPTSVNIVGDRRIGKSSLLHYIYRNYENLLPSYNRQPTEFIVVYLSLRDARCQTVDNFYQAIAEQLLMRSAVKARSNLADPLQVSPLDGIAFNRAMEAWKQEKVLPVICIDDFETLLEHRQQFNDGFYENLRYLASNIFLMLIIASRALIKDYRRRHHLTSSFFNVPQSGKLKIFSDTEAADLIRLPSGNPILTQPRQAKALKWGERHPYLLQLAGSYLWEEQQQGHSESWAEEKFREGAKEIPVKRNIVKQAFRDVARIGKLGQKIGDIADDLGNFVKGLVIITIVVGVLFKVVPWSGLSDLFQKTMKDIFENAETKSEKK